jgi:hypothetical protein
VKVKRVTAALALCAFLLIVSSTVLVPRAHADELDLLLNVPRVAHLGNTINIELWTVINYAAPSQTGGTRSQLTYNATGADCINRFPCLSFAVKANLNASDPFNSNSLVVPHVHTPSGGFVALPPFKTWVHLGAWITNYTVPSELGLYGVHVFANYTIARGVFFVGQAATTFSVEGAPAEAASLATTQELAYAVLGVATLAVLLDMVILTRKRIP